ncbi:MAG: hypothetical protein AAF357_06520 [Verrucomicrobiota bacterium]
MFSTKEFIDASREFVCVRLETFENKEHEALVRKYLNGRFANTVFTVLSPNAEEQLTRSSRSPTSVLGVSGRGPQAEAGSTNDVIGEMKEIAREYRARGSASDTILQDFHTFRQALNVASGDQRLLVFVAASEGDHDRIRELIRPVFAKEDIVGKFHLDFGSAETDADWSEKVSDLKGKSGFVVIQSDQFGLKGTALAHLPLNTDAESLASTLLAANAEFAENEERKDYSSHVSDGRREGIFFENEIPYGEDRDGDGEVDNKGKGGKGGKGKGGKGKG